MFRPDWARPPSSTPRCSSRRPGPISRVGGCSSSATGVSSSMRPTTTPNASRRHCGSGPATTRSNMWWPAEHRADLPWSQSGLTQYLEEWTDAMLTRRKFTAISGAALTVPVWNLLDHPAPSLASVVYDEAEYVTDPMMLLVEDTVARAQQLDDQQGGGAALNYVGDQFNAVGRLIRHASYGRPVGRRLCTALAQLAQTAGFMAYDGAGDDGLAQRWYMAGLRAAHTAGDRSLVASILSLLSNQAATRGHVNDGLQLASAAELAAANASNTVQALITARSCLAHAAAGDLSGLRRAREHSQAHLEAAHIEGLAQFIKKSELFHIDLRKPSMASYRSTTPRSAPAAAGAAGSASPSRARGSFPTPVVAGTARSSAAGR
jgi:hypothetical protein